MSAALQRLQHWAMNAALMLVIIVVDKDVRVRVKPLVFKNSLTLLSMQCWGGGALQRHALIPGAFTRTNDFTS